MTEATEAHRFVSIKIGATAQEALAAYGRPFGADDVPNYGGEPYTQLFYKGPLCVYENNFCYVIIQKNKVTRIADVKPEYKGF